MQLIISEKAIAGERIASILADQKVLVQREDFAQLFSFQKNGKEFLVIPLRGHISNVDFPKKYSYWRGTDLKELAQAPIEYVATEKAIVALLRKKAVLADSVVIATDADREGEAIGVEALRYLRESNPKIVESRAYFSAMTPKEINDAFANPVKVDFNFADSADCRREVDLIWGAVLTRFVSIMAGRMGKDFLSVGRVQTPVLALIVNREKERLAFKTQKYWIVKALFEKDQVKFEAEHKKGKLWDKTEAEEILKSKDAFGTVSKVESKQRILEKPVPFSTTRFLRQATVLGMTAGEAMNIAESLYQQGFTSYPRTDNETYPPTLDLNEILDELSKVSDFAPLVQKIRALGKLNPSRGKETKDHPPIHPAAAASKERLTEKQWRVYELICRRFLATLAEEAITLNTRVEILLKQEPFIANGQVIQKLGWKEYYPYSSLEETTLPKLEKGDKPKLLDLKSLEKKTVPPPRYSQSALIKLMEELGLGTKCFTGNTALKVFNSPQPRVVSMADVFEKSKPTGLVDDTAEIRQNKALACIGVSPDGTTARSYFKLSSKRATDSKSERMNRIVFSDSSNIEATSEHPILCFGHGKLQFKRVSDLKPIEWTAAYHDNSCLVPQGSIDWKFFAQHCDKKTYLFAHGLSKELKKKRLETNKTQAEFAKELGCSQGNYSAYEADKRPLPLWVVKQLNLVPNRLSSQNEANIVSGLFPLEINASLARILAKLIGDGSLDREKVKKENCFDFRYTNLNPDLIEEFVRDIEVVFKISSSVYVQEKKFSVKVPAAAGRVISLLFSDVLQKKPWKELPTALYPDFIGGFFDDEGHVNKSETKLFLSNTNHGTLRELQKMFLTLGIQSSLEPKQHKLFVRQRQSLFNFLEKIPIASVKKKQRLIEILSKNYNYKKSKMPLFMFEKQILGLLRETPKTAFEIAKEFKTTKATIVNRIRKLKREGKVKKQVEGNNKDTRRIIRYVSTVDLSNSAYALLNEKVIKPKLVTKTVLAIEEAPLPDYVFDITNSPEFPAFVLANNVVVHNSTRHEIIQKLYARRYIVGLKAIEPSQIAFSVITSLEKNCKKVTEPKLTADLESQMDEIASGAKTKNAVVSDSRKWLLEVLEQLLESKDEVAFELRKGLRNDSILGKCTRPDCQGQLIMRFGKTKKRFLGCTEYPRCTTTYPLPQLGKLSPTPKSCDTCGVPVIHVAGVRGGFEMCVNMDCKTKDEWKKKSAEKAAALAANPKAPTTKKVSKPKSAKRKSAAAPKPILPS